MTDTHTLIEHIFREEHGRVLAALIAHFGGDFELAEDALQDALVGALESWQSSGVPDNPGAWLMAASKRRAIDRLRKGGARGRQKVNLDELTPQPQENEFDEMDDTSDGIPDERLKLMFTCCHPALPLEAQVALTLRTLGGLSTAEIARAFLVPVPTMAQRIARAKTKIRDAGIPYRVPPADLLAERLEALLAVIYLIFNAGYVADEGEALIRHELCEEAIRLCRVLVELLPQDKSSSEAYGLLALMLLHDSRRFARTDAAGELVLLEDQDRALWDSHQIAEGLALIRAAMGFRTTGSYLVQAMISALHARAKSAQETDWTQIAGLYGALAEITQSPVVEVNRAVAVAMADGIREGLRLLMRLHDTLDGYYPFHAARADLLRRVDEREAAADAYERALSLCQNTQERRYLQRRLNELITS